MELDDEGGLYLPRSVELLDHSSLEGRPMYYDREAQPIPFSTWSALFEYGDAKRGMVAYRTVRRTHLAGLVEVSTVWLGLDHAIFGTRPLIFESMVFTRHEPVTKELPAWEYGDVKFPAKPYTTDTAAGYMERYSSEEEALGGHRRIVRALQEGRPLSS